MLSGVDQFDDPRKLGDGLRRAGIESGHEVLNAELSEAQNRRCDLYVSATDRIGPLTEVSRHGDVAARGPDQCRWISADVTAGLVNRGHLGHDRIRVPVPDRVPGVGVASDDAEHAAAGGPDKNGRASWPRSARLIDGIARLEELAIEGDAFPTEQWLDDRQRLLEAADTVIEGIAERVVLRLV